MPDLTFETPHHALNAYLATPEGKGPWPGVVAIHDVYGLTDAARRHGDWLAQAGFLALVPDLYSWGGKLKCIRATMHDLSGGAGQSFDDVDAARRVLAERTDCTGKIGIVGYCMGGRFALLTAAGNGFSVSAPNYGRLPDNLEEVMRGACPVVASFGKHDIVVGKGAAGRLEKVLEKLGIEHDVKEYPNSGHAFMDDHKGALYSALALFGLKFNEKDAADARARITAFFKRHLA